MKSALVGFLYKIVRSVRGYEQDTIKILLNFLFIFCFVFHTTNIGECFWGRSQWPRGLRIVSTASQLLGLRVRIPSGIWSSVSCECCVL